MTQPEEMQPDDHESALTPESILEDLRGSLPYAGGRLRSVAGAIQAEGITILDDVTKLAIRHWEGYGFWQQIVRKTVNDDSDRQLLLDSLTAALHDATTILVAAGQREGLNTDAIRLGERILERTYGRGMPPSDSDRQVLQEGLDVLSLLTDRHDGERLRQQHSRSSTKIVNPVAFDPRYLELLERGRSILEALRAAADNYQDPDRADRSGRLLTRELAERIGKAGNGRGFTDLLNRLGDAGWIERPTKRGRGSDGYALTDAGRAALAHLENI